MCDIVPHVSARNRADDHRTATVAANIKANVMNLEAKANVVPNHRWDL